MKSDNKPALALICAALMIALIIAIAVITRDVGAVDTTSPLMAAPTEPERVRDEPSPEITPPWTIATDDEPVQTIAPEPTPERVSRYPEISDADRETLARLVYAEARGESAEGQQAVAEVALNRVLADAFPDTVHEVIYQDKPCVQFSTASQLSDITPAQAQYDAVDAALYGEPVLPLGVVYFSTTAQNARVWGMIGGHVFCYI